MLSNKSKGFTLIELLIVIVIIGILAAVVLGILNPVQQQNRARDATIRSSLSKMALSGKSLFASSPRANDRSPTIAEFLAGVGGATGVGANCTGVNSTSTAFTGTCTYRITGVGLGATCGANTYSNSGTTQCNFAYWRNPTEFRVTAKGWAQPRVMFVFQYQENAGTIVEGFWSCGETYDAATTAPSAGAGCTNLN